MSSIKTKRGVIIKGFPGASTFFKLAGTFVQTGIDSELNRLQASPDQLRALHSFV